MFRFFRRRRDIEDLSVRISIAEERIEAFQAATIQRVVSLEKRIDDITGPKTEPTQIADPGIVSRELLRRLEEFVAAERGRT